MVTGGEISAAFAAFNAIKNIATSIVDLRDANLIAAKVGEINAKLIDAQQVVFAVNEERATLIASVRKLEEEVASFKTWQTEKQNYEPKSLSGGRALVYAPKPGTEAAKEPHWLCATCAENGRNAYMLIGPEPRIGDQRTWSCGSCRTQFTVSWGLTPQTPG